MDIFIYMVVIIREFLEVFQVLNNHQCQAIKFKLTRALLSILIINIYVKTIQFITECNGHYRNHTHLKQQKLFSFETKILNNVSLSNAKSHISQ